MLFRYHSCRSRNDYYIYNKQCVTGSMKVYFELERYRHEKKRERERFMEAAVIVNVTGQVEQKRLDPAAVPNGLRFQP